MRRYDRNINMNAFSYRVQTLQPSAIREILKFTADPEVISFAAGNPAPEAFPTEEIARITNDILTNTPIDALQYSITEGYAPLREWIRQDLKKKGMFDEHSLFLRHPFRFLRSIHASLESSTKRNFDTSRVIHCKEIGYPCHYFVIHDKCRIVKSVDHPGP